MAGYWSSGLWTRTVTKEFLLSIPVVVPAVFLGRAVNRRFSGPGFLRYIYGALAVIGALLVFQATRHGARVI